MSLEVVDAVELLELTAIQCVETGGSGFAQDLQLGSILRLALFDEAQALAQDLARVLVTTRPDQLVDELLLVLSQHHVSCRHRSASVRWARPREMAYYAIAGARALRNPITAAARRVLVRIPPSDLE